jgi:serine phosphatase RsbU (regulator of sigma subunit)
MQMFRELYYFPQIIVAIFPTHIVDIVNESLLHNKYIFLYYALFVLLIVLLFITLQTRSLNRTKKLLIEKEEALVQNEIQREELESKNKSNTDSLVYAQRIQDALLPSEEYFRSHFKESFIFYLPKDIISGDFFWIGEKRNKIFVVAADCTGHGVPGALMSMIGHDLLSKSIDFDNMEHPSEVLNIMSKGLEKTFNREKNIGSVIRDTMDIGLCVVDKEKRMIEFSGALFSLYIIRDNRLIDLRGDRHTLGMLPPGASYTNNVIDLKEDDMLYLFSDGYADQFGGPENKKYMYRRFRYLLTTIHRFPVEDQKAILEENIKTWMGINQQVDDILVMGFKPL